MRQNPDQLPGSSTKEGTTTVIRMQDIAARAGVSVSTVSRALRHRPGVGDATARAIRDIADQLGFVPNAGARHLRGGKTRTIGVAIPALNNWYFSRQIAAIEADASDAGYDTLVSVVSDPESLDDVLRNAQPDHGWVDGLIVVDMLVDNQALGDFAASGATAVTIGTSFPSFSSVEIDDVAIGHDATSLLVGLGHRDIGLIKGKTTARFGFEVPARRRSGYLQALKEAGLETHPELEAEGSFSIEGGAHAAEALFSPGSSLPPSALFCMSDQMAFGAIATLERIGYRVPDDVSIVGVDDHELAGVAGLTTVRALPPAIGSLAFALLLRRLEGDTAVEHMVIPTELILRRTVSRKQ